jgi:hypothetical protein
MVFNARATMRNSTTALMNKPIIYRLVCGPVRECEEHEWDDVRVARFKNQWMKPRPVVEKLEAGMAMHR